MWYVLNLSVHQLTPSQAHTYRVGANVTHWELRAREREESAQHHTARAGPRLPPTRNFLLCLVSLLKCVFPLRDLVCLKNADLADLMGRNLGGENGSQVLLGFQAAATVPGGIWQGEQHRESVWQPHTMYRSPFTSQTQGDPPSLVRQRVVAG